MQQVSGVLTRHSFPSQPASWYATVDMTQTAPGAFCLKTVLYSYYSINLPETDIRLFSLHFPGLLLVPILKIGLWPDNSLAVFWLCPYLTWICLSQKKAIRHPTPYQLHLAPIPVWPIPTIVAGQLRSRQLSRRCSGWWCKKYPNWKGMLSLPLGLTHCRALQTSGSEGWYCSDP